MISFGGLLYKGFQVHINRLSSEHDQNVSTRGLEKNNIFPKKSRLFIISILSLHDQENISLVLQTNLQIKYACEKLKQGK